MFCRTSKHLKIAITEHQKSAGNNTPTGRLAMNIEIQRNTFKKKYM